MTDPANDIFGQAREGSVAAIIQILNERLTDAGIRTRAVFADGILQLLCEAPTPEQLDQPSVVEKIRKLLETISPRRIYKVNINSRIVREQQLLWLEEINRDPERHLLWSEMITLKQPHFIKQLIRDLKPPKPRPVFSSGVSESDLRQRKSFMRGIFGGVGAVILLLLLTGLFLKNRFSVSVDTPEGATAVAPLNSAAPLTGTASETVPGNDGAANPATPSPQDTSVGAPNLPSPSDQVPIPEDYDSFAKAVRLAEQTAVEGQNANTPEEWLQLAASWQQASDLMAEVPTSDNRYQLAQDRVDAYQTNSEVLLQKAGQAR
ncbi:MAG: hypothetical protein AAGC54_16520 [Cyanobacteria bacterium P01_F01_bin.4]